MKVPRTISKLLENKYVLYVVLFLAITNLLGYMMMENINALVFFILVAFLTSNFSKNMIVVLLTPLVLTSVLMVGARVKEGFKEGIKTKEELDADVTTATTAVTAATAKLKTATEAVAATPSDAAAMAAKDKATTDLTEANAVLTAANNAANATEVPKKDAATTEPSVLTALTAAAGGAAAQQAGSGAAPETCPAGQTKGANGQCGMTTMYKKGNRIDYASTVEDAYGDLNKILGGDGIKNLTGDTQRLMDQQMQLAEAMKGMSPLLEQAKSMLQGFDMKNLDSLAGMAKNFGASASVTK